MDHNLDKVYKSTLKFLVPLTPEETYSTIAKEAMKLVGAQIGSILLEENGLLKRIYSTDEELYKIVPRKRGYTYRVFRSNHAKFLTREQIARIHPEIKETQIRSDIIIPLSYQRKAIGVLSVLSKRKKNFTEQDLNTLKLFGPLATLAIRKTQLYDDTRKAVETRDLFISMASHELKTPLTTINVYAQLIQKKLSIGNKFEPRWIDTILKEIKRLTNLISELLQVDQIKTGKLNYDWQECDLTEIVERSVRDFKLSHTKHKVIYENSESNNIFIIGDVDKLLQVITNLMNNSAKFAKENTAITVSLKKNLQTVELCVKDQGKGIHKKDIPHIFEGFYRGSEDTNEGMGLGLFLAKKIIEKHNGEVKVKSKVNQGTSFIIKFPLVSL